MARNNHNINSFVAGEVSKKFYGRTNSQAYNDSCEELSNMIVYPQGGVGKRPGTLFVDRILGPGSVRATGGILIPFSGTDGTRWQIVMTNGNPFAAISTYANVQAFNMATGANTNVTPFISGPGYFDMFEDFFTSGISLENISYAQDANNNLFIASKDFPPLQIIYDPADGSFDILCFLAYPSDLTTDIYQLQKRWPLQAKSFNVNVLTSPIIGATQITVNWATGATTLSSGSVDASWVGRMIQFTDGTNGTFWAIVRSFSVPNILDWEHPGGAGTPTTTKTYGGTSITQFYRLGYWDQISGWPRTVAFYDSRLVFGGNERFPEFLWFSEVQNYDDFLVPDSPVSSDPFSTFLREGNKPNKVCWIQSGKTMVVGTDFHEFILQAADPTGEIGFDNIKRTLETPHGSAYAQAVKLENTTVFLNRNAATLRELVYNFNEDSFTAADLNIFNPDVYKRHRSLVSTNDYRYNVGRPIIKQIVVEQQPDQKVWALTSDGFLACLSRERKQEVLAWSFHNLAGPSMLGDDAGDPWDGKLIRPYVHSISVNQAPPYNSNYEREVDELWMLVERPDYGGSGPTQPALFLERMHAPWDFPTIEGDWSARTVSTYKQAPIYLDCVYIHDDATTPSGGVIGLTAAHAVGSTVTVIVNGRYFGDYTVTGFGSIDISDKLNGETGFIAIIGYNYIGRLVPMIQEMPAQVGTTQGLPRRIHEMVVNFFDSIGARFGLLSEEDDTPLNEFEDITFPEPVDQDDPPLLFTGTRRLKMPLGYEERPRIVIEAHLPYPCNISHVVLKGAVYE